MLLDGLDNAVERAYAGWPDRLYIVGKDGRLAYKGRPGPGGFAPAEMEQALLALLKP
jgi:type I thyroxine 5'-deiodinase